MMKKPTERLVSAEAGVETPSISPTLLLPSCLLRLKPLSKPQYHGEAEIKLGLGGSHVTKHTQSGLMIKI
jgi:hypothetical protein